MVDYAAVASGNGQDGEPQESGQDSEPQEDEPQEEEKPLGDIESGGTEDVEPEPFIEQEVPPGE